MSQFEANNDRRHSATAIEFNTTTQMEWGRKKHGFHGQAEWFGVYSPDTGKVYMVPIEEVGKKQTTMTLRLEGSANNQEKGVHWAKDYEI